MNKSDKQVPLVKTPSALRGFKAGDGSWLHEIIHPQRDGVDIDYSLAHARVAAGERTTEHFLDQSELYYVLKGHATVHIDTRPYRVAKGSTLFIPPGARQWVDNPGPEDFVFLCLVNPPWTEAGEHLDKEE